MQGLSRVWIQTLLICSLLILLGKLFSTVHGSPLTLHLSFTSYWDHSMCSKETGTSIQKPPPTTTEMRNKQKTKHPHLWIWFSHGRIENESKKGQQWKGMDWARDDNSHMQPWHYGKLKQKDCWWQSGYIASFWSSWTTEWYLSQNVKSERKHISTPKLERGYYQCLWCF